MLYTGDVLGERYKIVREVGRGGMSIVYQADDLRLSGKLWAVKEFTYSNSANDAERREEERAFLRKEAEIMKKLDHPTLPRIVDIIETNGTLYIIVDYIEGVSLDKVLNKRGAVEQDAVIEWGKQLSAALDYMHTQNPPIIYQDMKPSNIMLKPDGTVRIIDFGIAGEYREGKSDGTNFGTKGYAAPEQEDGNSPIDARTDIYSLGITLHHLVTGKSPLDPPYEIKPIRSYNPKLSMGLEWIIRKCTQLDPKDRFQSCAELNYILENPKIIDIEYVRQLKQKRNVFILSVVMVFVFGLVGLFSMQMKKTETEQLYAEYKSWETVEGYERALDLKQIPEAYQNLISALRNTTTGIYPNEATAGYVGAPGEILDSTLSLGYFSSDALSALKQQDLETYVSVNYELGRLYWNCYQGSTSLEAMSVAMPYFRNAITAAAESDETYGGLTRGAYELARYHYVTSYLQNWNWNDGADDGRIEVDPALKIAMGLEVDDTVDVAGLYEIFWQSLNGVKKSVNDTATIGEEARLNTLSRLLYIYKENCRNFCEKKGSDGKQIVSAEEAVQFFGDIQEAIESLREEGYNDDNVDSLLLAAEKQIEAIYDVALEP